MSDRNYNDLLVADEVADILGVSTFTIAHWRNRKIFGVPFFAPTVKLGGTWYYERELVEQLKEVYQKGTLQDIHKLARAFSDSFQKSCPSSCIENSSTDLFTTEEVANFFDVDISTLSRWNESKKFQPFIIDHAGGFHYTRAQLMELKALCDKEKKPSPRAISGGQSLKNFFEQPENSIVKKVNVQIYPNKQRIVPNCKLAKVINNLSDDSYSDMVVNGNERKIREKKNHKKYGDVLTSYQLVSNSDCDDSDPLTEFDRAVLSVCISEWEIGNRHTTPAIILRGLTGKVGSRHVGKGKIHKDQHAAIIHSLKKLISIILDTDLSCVNEQLNYHEGKSQKITEPILPAKLISTFINGQSVEDVIFFLDESPVMKIARDRKQLLTFDATLLDVPKQNNTPMNITIKNYVITRVLEIKLHHLTPVITFDDVFKKCRIENASRKTKMDARNAIIEFFKHFQSKGEIKTFEVTKKTNSFYSIKFSYTSKSPSPRQKSK